MSNLRQAEQKVVIEGILSEINLEKGTFIKNGKEVGRISGSIKVHVDTEINGEKKTLEIPVHMFASEKKNDGNPNPAYASIERVMTEYKSIAQVGIEAADRIRINRGEIQMNEFYGRDGREVSYPRIRATFVNQIPAGAPFTPQAKFEAMIFVALNEPEIGPNEEETGRQKIIGVLPQYGGKVDVVPFYGVSKGVIDAVSQYWEVGSTVKVIGRLDFSVSTETVIENVGFGEPIEKVRTTRVSDLIITGGSEEPIDEDFAFPVSEIDAALAERRARLQEQKERSAQTGGFAQKAAPKPNYKDLGF